ncbi:MAG: methionine synthase [Propioniciclava sp.]
MSRTRITGTGSLPGTDIEAATRLVGQACPDLIPFPELPARGPHAAMVGRSLALLAGLDAGYEAGEWRIAATPGPELRRARQTWRDDLERFQEASQGQEGTVKIGIAGPVTLSATVLRPRGGLILADRGARRDVAQALAEGAAGLRADWARRSAVDLMLQIDEPALPAALSGAVPTEGGYFRHRPLEQSEAAELLRSVAGEVLHVCAPGLPMSVMLDERGAGFDAIAVDAALLSNDDQDALALAVERGRRVHLGLIPTASGGPVEDTDALTRRALRLAERLGLPAGSGRLVLSPACGLAGWQPAQVPAVFAALATVAQRLDEA